MTYVYRIDPFEDNFFYKGLSDFNILLKLIREFGPSSYIQGETKTFK